MKATATEPAAATGDVTVNATATTTTQPARPKPTAMSWRRKRATRAVVSPFYVHSPQRCSWEEPYDFTPKIHHYRGVSGVVHRAWTEPPPAAPSAEAQTTDLSTAAAGKATAGRRRLSRNHTRTRSRPPWNRSKHVPSSPPASRAASAASRRSPSTGSSTAAARGNSPAKSVPSQGRPPLEPEQAKALVAAARSRYRCPRPPQRTVPTSSKAREPTSAAAPPPPAAAAEARVARARVPQRPSSSAQSRSEATTARVARAHAPQPYHATASASFVPLPTSPSPVATSKEAAHDSTNGQHNPLNTPSRRSNTPVSRYRPRTQAAYTLPPDYATQSWVLERYTSPDVVVSGSAQHRWAGPAKPHTVHLNRHLRQHTRQALLHAYSSEARRWREDRYRRGLAADSELRQLLADDTDGAAHNYNFAAGADLFEDDADARAADFYAKEARMRAELIAGVVPLASVLQPGAVSATPSSTHTITAVLDDGHACSPILLRTSDSVDVPADLQTDSASTAVLVRPCVPEELPGSWRDVRQAEFTRVLPKGREWDRQHAIKTAVGATCQEAIIDLLVDPRYRRPGEYLRQHVGTRQRPAHPFAV